MLRWYLSPTPNFFSDWLWPYCAGSKYFGEFVGHNVKGIWELFDCELHSRGPTNINVICLHSYKLLSNFYKKLQKSEAYVHFNNLTDFWDLESGTRSAYSKSHSIFFKETRQTIHFVFSWHFKISRLSKDFL